MTVTRLGGANGRVMVPYTGVTNSPPGTTNGTLVFDDYQMSASITVPAGADRSRWARPCWTRWSRRIWPRPRWAPLSLA